ncbi:DUF6193 family natural product biosynthesis protein [Streptomyces sp. NPDC051577]|uniref:DUF6193 family natural product biosynthesis protein n=1 Tax=Streptomyces sp. NPDC051577 TaxID=3155166 RepID=UPI003427E0E6
MTSNSADPSRRVPSPTEPDPYPDLTSAGSLAAALESVAAGLGLGWDPVLVSESDPLRSAGVASEVVDRETCWITLGSAERQFLLSGWCRGVRLISGSTPDLGDMALALEGWRKGATLREIHEAAPFVTVTELARAHEHGPAAAVAVGWRLLLEGLRQKEDLFSYARSTLRIAEAAYAEPKLRRLYPFTSHRSLHFTTCVGIPYSRDVPHVDPLSDGRYRVHAPSRGAVIGDADTPEAAVALVVSGLPVGCGPAVAGASGDR